MYYDAKVCISTYNIKATFWTSVTKFCIYIKVEECQQIEMDNKIYKYVQAGLSAMGLIMSSYILQDLIMIWLQSVQEV